MSALARYFRFMDIAVAGYDKTETPLTAELSNAGIAIHYEDNVALIPESFLDTKYTLVVYTPAVATSLSEYLYLEDNGFVIKKRSEVLGMITKDSFCFAVAGTHGKTTTSAILAHLLKEAGIPITAFLGGISEDFNSNFLLEGTEYSVVEADEFDRSFLRLAPTIACITSMDADHLDIYGNADALTASFVDFTKCIKPGGKLFVRKGLPIAGITYGIDDASDFCIKNISIADGSYVFDLETPDTGLTRVRFNKPGRHNLLNALVAFAMALESGVAPQILADALATFKGVQRRFSYKIKTEDFVFIDDYAHHPTEIDAVFNAITEMHPNKKVLAVFQPHLFSRTRDFVDAFAASLSQFPNVLLLNIYPAREQPIAGVDSEWLLSKMTSANKKKIEKEELLAEIRKQDPEVLITMGAGDIGLEVEKIKNKLANAN